MGYDPLPWQSKPEKDHPVNKDNNKDHHKDHHHDDDDDNDHDDDGTDRKLSKSGPHSVFKGIQ